jgi:AcrR family transcriptional regulator
MSKRPNEVITESITEALLQLMNVNEFGKITVTDITKEAGVGRASFYRNFGGKEDVIRKRLMSITDEFMERMNFDFRRDAHKFYITGLFLHLESNRDLIELLRRCNLLFLIKEEFDRAFLKRVDKETPKYICYMASGAYYNLFYYWVQNGYKETPEELAELKFSI